MAMAAFLALLWITGGVGAYPPADQPPGQKGVAIGSTMSLMMKYQGRLLDPTTGDPKPDGAYSMTFSIYDVSTGGTALWSETKNVEVKGGLFNAILGDVTSLPAGIFTGQDLWLGIKVGADPETSPRQQLLPMPYAIYAKNADTVDGMEGADLQRRVSGTCASGNAIRVINADGTVTCEADDDTTYTAGTGLSLSGTTFSVNFAGSGAANTAARSDHNHSAADIASGTLSSDRFSAYGDLSAEGYLNNDADGDLPTRSQADSRYVNEGQATSITSAMIADGATLAEILDDDGAGSGLDADLLDGRNSSDFALAGHGHWGATWTGTGKGLTLSGGTVGLSGSGSSDGVYGESTAGFGVRGVSTNNDGVFGKSSLSNGVHGESDSGDGVYGYSKDGSGVRGESVSGYGGFFSSGSDHGDLVLGGAVGRINTDPNNENSDLILSSSNDVIARLDNDSGENGVFRIKNSGGVDVCTVDESGNLTASGDVKANRVVYSSPRTQYFVVGSEGFVPGSNVDYVNTYGNGGAYISASGGHALVAPVHLPQGAVVTGFKVFFYDNSSGDMTVALQLQYMTGGGYASLAQVSSSGIAGYDNRTTASISYATIDNTIRSYHVYAYSTAWDSNLKIKGALVTYTISEAP